jgi:DNA-binding transcriptional regulator YiaG
MPAISPPELRRILDKLDLTLAELARLCRIHPVSARRWGSTGVPDGPAAVLIRLLEAGKVSIRAIERIVS